MIKIQLEMLILAGNEFI